MAARLSRAEREEIRVGVVRGWSYRRIAVSVGRHASTIHREVTRNGGRGGYRAATAQRSTDLRARRPQLSKLEGDPQLCARVKAGLATMSPAPLSRILAAEGLSVSHETIYREAFRPDSVLGDAWKRLARARRYRKRRRCGRRRHDPKPLGVVCFVTDRVADLAREPGHWEGDLIIGAANRSAAVVLTERASRFTLIGALESQTTREVVAVTIGLLDRIDPMLRVSLCWDQGRELTNWRDIHQALNIDLYFCHPRSPWQKPLVENTCGLLRRWLPKHTNLYRPQSELDTIAQQLNTMPRRILNWNTAQHEYDHLVATTT